MRQETWYERQQRLEDIATGKRICAPESKASPDLKRAIGAITILKIMGKYDEYFAGGE